MRKYVLGATLVAAGLVFHALPASADKLDDVLARLDAIEKNRRKTRERKRGAEARLRTVTSKQAQGQRRLSPLQHHHRFTCGRRGLATRTPTPPPSYNDAGDRQKRSRLSGTQERQPAHVLHAGRRDHRLRQYRRLSRRYDEGARRKYQHQSRFHGSKRALPDRKFRLVAGAFKQQLLSRRAWLPAAPQFSS